MRIVGRNRAPALSGEEIDLEIVGEVSESDLADLDLHRPAFTGPPTVQRLRDTHHGLARALAAGHTQVEAGRIAGYTATRVHMLMQDPAFQELVASYRAVNDEAFSNEAAESHRNAFAVVTRSSRLALDKLEDAEESGEVPSFGELANMVRVFGEFTGLSAAKRTINHNVNANLGDLLAAARARAFGPAPPTLPASPVAKPNSAPGSEED
jgi:hypothetical protein